MIEELKLVSVDRDPSCLENGFLVLLDLKKMRLVGLRALP